MKTEHRKRNGSTPASDAMGAEHYTSYIEGQESPTEALLNLWEARGNLDQDPISSLCNLLKSIGYQEAAASLKN